MTVISTEQNYFGEKPQTVGYHISTASVGESDTARIVYDFKPGFYEQDFIAGSASTVYFNADLTGEQISSSGITWVTGAYSQAFVPLQGQWGSVVGTFVGPNAGVTHQYYGQGYWLVSLGNTDQWAQSTTNGSTWSSFGGAGSGSNNVHAYVDGVYIFSTDGFSFPRTMTSTNPAGGSASWTTRNFFAMRQINLWTAVNPRLAGVEFSNTYATSQDGYTWTTRPTIGSVQSLQQAGAYNFALGNSSTLWYTTNNTTWTGTSIPTSTNAPIGTITFGNNVYVGVGRYWTTTTSTIFGMYYSTNGTTWTTIPGNPATSILGVNNQDNIFMHSFSTNTGMFVAFTTNRMAYSTNGINWAGYPLQGGGGKGYNNAQRVASTGINPISFVGTGGKHMFIAREGGSSFITYRSFTDSGRYRYNGSPVRCRLSYFGDIMAQPIVPTGT